MISFLLLQEIAQLFLILFFGWLLVRCRILKSSDSRILSVIVLYLIVPCSIITSFQLELTADRLRGMLLALIAAAVTQTIMFTMMRLLRRPLRLNTIEQASVFYSNASNLTIPLVASILGPEWVIYVGMFVVIQQPIIWSHGRLLISGQKQISLQKIFLNVNVLSVMVGLALFLLQITLPPLVQDTVNSVGTMIGPMCMIVAGMLMANVDFRALVKNPGIWKTAFLRLILIPLVLISVLKYSGLAALAPEGETILLVSLLSSITPTASVVTQLAQVYGSGSDGEYAGSVNVLTTLLCIVTIPLMIAYYQL